MLRAGQTPASPLVDKLLDTSDFPAAAGEASRAAGYRTPARESLPAPLASMVGRRMMASIMASDCHGRVGFYSTPDGYQLDDATPACDNLKPKKTVQAVAAVKPSVDPIGLNARIQELCAARQSIPVTYVDSGEPSRIACPQLPGSLAFFSLLPGDQHVVTGAAASIGE